MRYPVTTGALGCPRRLGCIWASRCSSAATLGFISSRKCLSQISATAASSQGASDKKRLNPAKWFHPQSDATTPKRSGLTERQPEQHGYEVLILGLREQLVEPFSKLAYLFIQAYNGSWHRIPSWSQALLFFLIPHGVLSCHFPFEKCKYRVI